MTQEDVMNSRVMNTVSFAMQVAGSHLTPATQAAHIADAAGDAVTECNAILVVLEDLGFVAKS